MKLQFLGSDVAGKEFESFGHFQIRPSARLGHGHLPREAFKSPHSVAPRLPSSVTHKAGPLCSAQAASAAGAEVQLEMPETEVDKNGLTRVKFRKDGWNFWTWRGHKVHYIKAGQEDKPPVVLVHGFGASAYHWRYVIPELAKKYCVHAVDLLGFGYSEKPSVVYNGYNIWSEQLSDFVKQRLGGRKTVFVGNSMGAYASLLTSANYPDVAKGLVLVNGAGKFDELKAVVEASAETALPAEPLKESLREAAGVSSPMPEQTISNLRRENPVESTNTAASQSSNGIFNAIVDPLSTLAKRTGIYIAFLAAKQPSRIKSVLRQVYVSQKNVDDELVQSIVIPAQDSNAPDVFYRVITSEGASINSLLPKLKVPLFLLWGELDPWIRPASADKIQKLLPSAERVDIQGGHCPHDDVPELFLPPLEAWLQRILA